MVPQRSPIVIAGSAGKKLAAVIDAPDAGAAGGRCVIMCHGMLSSKDGTKHVALSESLARSGTACVRFDFSGCGESEGSIEDTTISARIEDLEAVARETAARGYSSISLVGSSLGSATALLGAGSGLVPNVRSLVLFASVSRPERILDEFPAGDVARWRADGFFEIDGIRIKWNFLEDAAKHDCLGAACSIRCPVLLIHGSDDELVPVDSSREILEALGGEKKLVVIDGADHRFSAGEHLRRLVDLTVGWIEQRQAGRGPQAKGELQW